MTASPPPENTDRSLIRDLLYLARYYLGTRRGMLILAGLVLVAGLALNWSWLVAAGIAPILISVLPCVAMCALGLCMNKGGGKGCSTGAGEQGGAANVDVAPRVETANLTALPASRGDAPAAGEDGAHGTNPETQSSKERSTTDA